MRMEEKRELTDRGKTEEGVNIVEMLIRSIKGHCGNNWVRNQEEGEAVVIQWDV